MRLQARRQPAMDHVHPERRLEGGGAVGLIERAVLGRQEVEVRLDADIDVQSKRCLVDRQHFPVLSRSAQRMLTRPSLALASMRKSRFFTTSPLICLPSFFHRSAAPAFG